MEKKKILVIEDDAILRDALQTKLELESFNVETAANGEIGYTHLANNTYDVVLLDIEMPTMNGIEVLQKLKDNDIQANIIILSNSDESEHLASALEFNVTGFLVKKDWSIDSVVEKIRSVI